MISCKEYVEMKKQRIKNEVSQFERKPCLCVVQIGENAASDAYVKGKKRDCIDCNMAFELIRFRDEEDYSQTDIVTALKILNDCKTIDGIIIQLPIPDKYDIEELQKCISPQKDVDGFRKDSYFEPCTPKGIIDWLDYNDYDFVGKDVVVVGRSKIVGKPLVDMLIDKGATVTCCNSKTKMLHMKTKRASLVVTAIGKAKYFDKKFFTLNTTIIDVGINRDDVGKLCGDVDYQDVMKNKVGVYITPVPGGVGLLTRCALLENTIQAYKMQTNIK